MDKLITALAPVFAAGLAIQQLGEILDPILDKVGPTYKRVVLALVSLSLGLIVAFGANLHVLALLGAPDDDVLNPLVTGLIISGGTEGINSILKFLKYKKEDAKNDAAVRRAANAAAAVEANMAVVSPEALAQINRK
jgi:hypothetical protein